MALSSDGNTAIIGAYFDDVGANGQQGSAYVFTRSGGVWTQQQRLNATGGATNDNFGRSVALSSDGNTAVVGATSANSDVGAAYAFTRSGSTWTQQGGALTPSSGAASDNFGASVALSSNGNTAIIGASRDEVGANTDQGSATVYTRSGSTWTRQATLTANDGDASNFLGTSVALSSDGNTAIAGAPSINAPGSATVFTRSGSTWTQQGASLTDGNFNSLGRSVALSSDGNTALIGASGDTVGSNDAQGSVYMYTRSGGVWTKQRELTAFGGLKSDNLGSSVAMSGDGNTALVGARVIT